jgi:uncharacterized protein YbjT (DUF2867 family)
MSRQITVFGATGTAGSAVVRALLKAGWRVRAATRDITTDKARSLEASGAELVVADLASYQSVLSAIQGVDAVYLSGPSLGNRWDIGQAVHGINVADALASSEPKHLIYQSALVGDARGVLSVGSKRAIEERIAELQLPVTVVRPGVFMDNLMTSAPIEKSEGKLILAMPIPVTKENGMVSAHDIGRAAVAILDDQAKFQGEQVDLVSDVLNLSRMARIVGDEVGMDAIAVEVPLSAVDAHWPQGRGLFKWLGTRTTKDSPADLERLLKEPLSFREWTRQILAPFIRAKFNMGG